MKQWSIEKKILLGFLLAVALLLGMGSTSYLTLYKYIHATKDMLIAQAALSEAGSLLALNNKAESNQRAFLITEDDFYLQSRNQSIQLVRERLGELQRQKLGLASLAELESLAQLAEERFLLLDEVLKLRQQNGLEAVRLRLLERPGLEQVSAFSNAIDSIIVREQQRMERQAASLKAQSMRMVGSLSIVVVLAVLFLALLYRHFVRTMLLRAQAEQRVEAHARALGDSEARVRAIVDTAVDAIITIDERGLIESFNPSAERIFGYTASEVAGKNVSCLMPSPYRDEHDTYLDNYKETGVRKIIGIGREVFAQHKEGAVFPVDLAVGEMRVSGKRMYAGMIRDISERKHAQERQEQLLKELTAVNEELKNFAYVVSHDLKAPLRAIGSLADWIVSDYADKFDAEGKENMRLLVGRVRRMDRLIDGILEYSRVGRMQEAQVDINLNQLVAEVLLLLAPPINIIVSVASLPHLYAEKTRIHQVFQNLIGNAIQYQDKPQGEIRVDCVRDDAVWRFSVADNGLGISERHFERIFQLFQTLKSKDKAESTGVGLALVKKNVEMYGGKVWVESQVGQGTTFFFTLPVKPFSP